ncbi:hypothetical protein NCCP2222_27290 [Sporosarcina sp. NCCP-2222]|uniref:DUF5360 family protein n=1 Tax=Sporosarcina sp. NCCP-2222 TaxID=2935073 RepID=UPI00208DA10D|nr:DUF5360 family protein [Sporosarcina sp. NCCP-2222]GKV56782.1 hypothetical protein NCCP2222_27290 [Sporosarcina sp. NCCP-2222]
MGSVQKQPSMRVLQWFFVVIDVSFILYFGATALKMIPLEYAYSDYTNPIMVAWNWSFFPLDMAISITGLTSIYLHRKNRPEWKPFALISLVLTFCSGLMAISYWSIRLEFDMSWWTLNLVLMLYPLFFIPRFIKGSTLARQS